MAKDMTKRQARALRKAGVADWPGFVADVRRRFGEGQSLEDVLAAYGGVSRTLFRYWMNQQGLQAVRKERWLLVPLALDGTKANVPAAGAQDAATSTPIPS